MYIYAIYMQAQPDEKFLDNFSVTTEIPLT